MSLSALGARLWQRKSLRLGLVALLLFGALLALVATRLTVPGAHAAPLTHAAPVKPASGWCHCVTFLHTATPANSQYDSTELDESGVVSSLLTNNPSAFLLVTPDINPGGGSSVVFDQHPIGVFHGSSAWYIFNQDGAPIPRGAAFNVYAQAFAVETPVGGNFVHTATSANSAYDYTIMDDPHLNGQPNLRLFVTPNWNPGFAAGVYNNHPIGVFYAPALGRWCIFNQDLAPIPAGAAFNVWYEPPGFSHTTNTLQTVTSTNVFAGTTVINDASLNGNRGALLFVTPVWNPGGVGGVYDNHPVGVGYDGTNWRIFNEDGAPIRLGAAFYYDTF